jgi:hypothetical protein
MRLLATDGASMAIGISFLFIVVGVVMKRVFVSIFKNGVPSSGMQSSHLPEPTHE